MKKTTILIVLLCLMALFVVSDVSIDLPAKDETFSISIPTEVKQVLRDTYRKPSIEKDDIVKVDGWNRVYFYLSYEKYNGTGWEADKKRLSLWSDFNVESRYISFQNETVTTYDQYSKKEFAEIRIKKAVTKWAMKEYEKLNPIAEEKIDIGTKTIDLNG